MASTQPISRRSNATVRSDHRKPKKPLIESNQKIKNLKKNSEAETSASSFSHEEKLASRESRQQQSLTAQILERIQQERLREALDKELDELDLPKLEEQAKRIPRKAKNLDWVPDSIVITNKDYGDNDDDDNDDESDNCSLISGLTLPQEISLLRQIADKHYHTQKKLESSRNSSKSNKSSIRTTTSSSSRKTRNKVASNQISSKPVDVPSSTSASNNTARRKKRHSRPTTDAGDLKPDRAQNMEIEIKMNGVTLSGCYSGALSHNVPRKPNGAGIIKFDNGDMYMGDMKDGQMHGHGTLVNGDTVLRGEFEHNMFVL